MSKITPVLLGADLNCYSVARAFFEAYSVSSYAFGKYRTADIAYSKIVKFCEVKNLSEKEILCKTLEDFARAHSGEELYLIPCTDEYAEAVISCAARLEKNFFFSCPSAELASNLCTKEAFYKICEKHNLSFPKTEFFYTSSSFMMLKNLPFPYPIIIKPSSSAEYWRAPFDGMKKVYTAQDEGEAAAIIEKIYAVGYKNSIILQELIPCAEDSMYVLTSYSGSNAKVSAACMGHVLLGEHTPKGLGNHVAIITEEHSEITNKLLDFLDDIGYRGFANFDIIFDKRDERFKLLEINLRQGRSNYYMTAAGINIAKLIVEDKRGSLACERNICRENFFWHTVPIKIIYRYITDNETKKLVQKLASSGKSCTTLFYKEDLLSSPLRAAYVLVHNMRYFGKYSKYR